MSPIKKKRVLLLCERRRAFIKTLLLFFSLPSLSRLSLSLCLSVCLCAWTAWCGEKDGDDDDDDDDENDDDGVSSSSSSSFETSFSLSKRRE